MWFMGFLDVVHAQHYAPILKPFWGDGNRHLHSDGKENQAIAGESRLDTATTGRYDGHRQSSCVGVRERETRGWAQNVGAAGKYLRG